MKIEEISKEIYDQLGETTLIGLKVGAIVEYYKNSVNTALAAMGALSVLYEDQGNDLLHNRIREEIDRFKSLHKPTVQPVSYCECTHPDHTEAKDCLDRAVGCSKHCVCCMGELAIPLESTSK